MRSIDLRLVSACQTCNMHEVLHCISAEADPNVSVDGMRPLHWAAYAHQNDIAAFLLLNGASPWCKFTFNDKTYCDTWDFFRATQYKWTKLPNAGKLRVALEQTCAEREMRNIENTVKQKLHGDVSMLIFKFLWNSEDPFHILLQYKFHYQ